MTKMQFSSIAILLLSSSFWTVYAFIESDSITEFSSFEYTAPELEQVADWEIIERPLNNTSSEGANIQHVDGRSGKPTVIFPQVGDASILPGNGVGNRLLWTVGTSHDDGHGPMTDHRMLSEAAEAACKTWITEHQEEMGINVDELFAKGMVRTATHPDGDIQLSLRRTYNNIEVVDSRVAINIVAGNIVTVAVEQWGDIAEDFDTIPSITAEDALDALAIHADHSLMTGEETCDSELQILTLVNNDVDSTGSLRGTTRDSLQPTHGYKHVLVWKVCPKFDGQDEAHMFKGYVNAHTKETIEFTDTIEMLEVEGGVFPMSNDGRDGGIEQANWPMPFMKVGNSQADVGGNFNVPGTALFRGEFVFVRDDCAFGGSGSLSVNVPGGINWGTSGGTDCARGRVGGKEVGGRANTRSSRTTYYHTSHIADIARRHLPNENWLKQPLRARVNINNSCNAFWNGFSINFYSSGDGCSNFGEISGVIIHEWGHGMDFNDIEGEIARPSGEGIADLYAALYDGSSCIARGALENVCNLKGDKCKQSFGCTGIRDIDYMRHNSERPHTMTWARANCGNSVHCKGHVYSEAVWSLYKRKLPELYGYDDLTALEVTTYLLYKAAGNVRIWYHEKAQAQQGGCGAFTGYRAFLVADDNDGNLDNGTPHMRAIYEAFHDQEIACNDKNVRDSQCSNIPVDSPSVTATPGDMKVRLTWFTVDNALSYDIMRAEGGCEKGKVKVATKAQNEAGVISHLDTGLKNGFEYCYLIVPKGTPNPSSCYGKKSTAVRVRPGVLQEPEPIPLPPPSPLPTNLPTPIPSSQPTPLPTNLPTPAPSNAPSSNPTAGPSNAPTSDPTPSPSNAPSSNPTPAPSNAPTPAPTAIATNPPTSLPTSIPTAVFTAVPTPAPTAKPSEAPTSKPTETPTDDPTSVPTSAPTNLPTATPSNPPIGDSPTFCNPDADEKIFKLELNYKPEVSSQLSWKLNSFDISTETFVDFKESDDAVRQTQRICVPPGTYEIVISDSEGSGMSGGSYVGYLFGNEIFASDPTDDSWTEKRHIFCYGECASTSPSLSPSHTTESPSMQPSLRSSSHPSSLPSLHSSFEPSDKPTPFPSAPPREIIAEYDPDLMVPKCAVASSSCSTGNLVNGRGELGPENNSPNSLDGCTDSNAGDYTVSESIEAITVSSNGQGNMKEGDIVTITARVVCWYTGANDIADFYYSTISGEGGNPLWIYIDSVECSQGNEQELSTSYELPRGSQHAVRVNFSYRVEERGELSSCVEPKDGEEYYNDVDDLVFMVEENIGIDETLI